MATTMRPVLCPHCGAQVRKNGYCSECYLPLSMLKKAQNTSNYYYNIGYDRASARDLSGAIESLLQALRYNKRNVPARNLLGLIYYEMGEAVQAMSEWVMSINYQQENNLATKYLKELKKIQPGWRVSISLRGSSTWQSSMRTAKIMIFQSCSLKVHSQTIHIL